MTPYPYQEENAQALAKLVYEHGVGLDASPTGSGKSITFIRTCQIMGVKFAIITTKSGQSGWRLLLEDMDVEDLCHGIYTWGAIRKTDFTLPPDVMRGFDEFQNGKGATSQQGRGMERLSDTGPSIMMSASPCASALDSRALLHALKQVHTNRWYDFLPSIGGWQNPHQNYRWMWNATPENVAKLNAMITPFMVKTPWDKISGMQDNIIQADAVTVPNAQRVNSLYRDLNNTNDNGELQRLRTVIEGFRVEAMVEMAKEYMAEGNSVVGAFNFTDALMDFSSQMGCEFIRGQVSDKNRARIIEDFQTSDKPKCLAINIKAGGSAINLHDLNGFPRRVLISPTWSAYDYVQVTGRCHRQGGKSTTVQKILFCGDTVEEVVLRVVRKKLNCLDQLLDTDLEAPVPQTRRKAA